MRIFSLLPPSIKRLVIFGLRFAVLAGLLVYAFNQVGRKDLLQQLERSDWRLVLLGTLLLAAQIPVAAWRWALILKELGFQMRGALAVRLVVMGLFLSQVLPGAVAGDAFRVWLTMKTGCSVKHSVNSVTLDRLVMLATLFLLAGLIILCVPNLPPILQQPLLALILVAVTLFGISLVMLADRFPAVLNRWRVFRAVGYLAMDSRAVLLNWRGGLALLILSVGSYINMSGCMYLFALALGQSVDFWIFFLCSLPVILVSILPLSIGGWGTREVTAIAILASIGVEPVSAVLISALFGTGNILISLPGAIFLFLDTRNGADPINPI